MGYDAYDHSRRDSSQPSYLDDLESKISDLRSPRSSDVSHHRSSRSPSISQDTRAAMDPKLQSPAQSQPFTSYQDPAIQQPTTSTGPTAPLPANIPPELIAQIAEQVTREVVQKLAQNPGNEATSYPPPPAPELESRRASSIKSASTTSPPPDAPRRIYTPPSPAQAPPPRRPTQPSISPELNPTKSARETAEEAMNSRYTDRTAPDGAVRATRPSPVREPSAIELSAIDQKWGKLFENDHTPTPRLGQILRGIANHIIECFEPRNSIVVTPEKMAKFYSVYRLESERHPFHSIFASEKYDHISQLYIDLVCQHHFVQQTHRSRPEIPSLTPLGFQQWMTSIILAYPDDEAQRLQKVFVNMPINADGEFIDGKPERLPKQISRYLLPKAEDRKSKRSVDEAISDFLDEAGLPQTNRPSTRSTSRPRHVATDIPPNERPAQTSVPPLERERMPYTGTHSTATEGAPTEETIRINERERQPYTSQPGTGARMSSDDINPPPPQTRQRRSSSIRSPTRPEHLNMGANSAFAHRQGPPRARRPSSPPILSYSKSTPLNINESGSAPSSGSYPSGSGGSYGNPPHSAGFPPPPPPSGSREKSRDFEHEDDLYRAVPRDSRRPADEDSRLSSMFTSPRDAERWDRTHETRSSEGRTGAAYEEFYRHGRGTGTDGSQYNPRYYT